MKFHWIPWFCVHLNTSIRVQQNTLRRIWYLPEAKKAFRSRRGHAHGTLLHSQGTPLKVAQAQLGHSHMATTLEIYTHASGSAQRDAVNLLAEQLFPNVPKLESSGRTAEKESQLVQ